MPELVAELEEALAVVTRQDAIARPEIGDVGQARIGQACAFRRLDLPVLGLEPGVPSKLRRRLRSITRTLGPVRDDEKKHHPDLIPYSELSEGEKQFDRDTAIQALKFILARGYQILPPTGGAPSGAGSNGSSGKGAHQSPKRASAPRPAAKQKPAPAPAPAPQPAPAPVVEAPPPTEEPAGHEPPGKPADRPPSKGKGQS